MTKDTTQNTIRSKHTDNKIIPRPTAQVAQRVEELLREQLSEMGENVSSFTPEDIIKHMKCHVAPDNSMSYFWKDRAILSIVPEINEDSILWRMFTKDDKPIENIEGQMAFLGETDENS